MWVSYPFKKPRIMPWTPANCAGFYNLRVIVIAKTAYIGAHRVGKKFDVLRQIADMTPDGFAAPMTRRHRRDAPLRRIGPEIHDDLPSQCRCPAPDGPITPTPPASMRKLTLRKMGRFVPGKTYPRPSTAKRPAGRGGRRAGSRMGLAMSRAYPAVGTTGRNDVAPRSNDLLNGLEAQVQTKLKQQTHASSPVRSPGWLPGPKSITFRLAAARTG